MVKGLFIKNWTMPEGCYECYFEYDEFYEAVTVINRLYLKVHMMNVEGGVDIMIGVTEDLNYSWKLNEINCIYNGCI